MRTEKNDNSGSLGFKINMQILVDAYEEKHSGVTLMNSNNDSPHLTGARLYSDTTALKEQNVYIAEFENIKDKPIPEGICLVVIGGDFKKSYKGDNCCIVLPEALDPVDVLMETLEVLDTNKAWDMKLQNALNLDRGIAELCNISYEYFKNPLFVHDNQFYILACPVVAEGMTKWEVDARTGMQMVSTELLNDFKIDEEYIQTLSTTKASIFSANQRGYRILYVNMWNDNGSWSGRLCINEVQHPMKPGQFVAAEYFTQILKIAFRRHNIVSGGYERPFETILKDIINQRIYAVEQIEERISYNKWNLYDSYVCMKIGLENRTVDLMAAISTCNTIENSIDGSYAFVFEENILIVVNLTMAGLTMADCMTKMAYIIREGLFVVGVSDEYSNFALTPYYYRQACIAHDYGKKSDSTRWCHQFEDFALDYMLENACGDIPPQHVCLGGLQILQAYDNKNETELYKTLKVYLQNERNAVHTAKELFIHRSTLFYRLDRIKELIHIDLDNPRTRLYINISYRILEQS
ncbi:MAG: helix-turn-helix domain-containing protein [Lachnospiraceae bacterium]|nr:helix-turn-helix domain-containing protein [Lachnospiraceae bacterium]